MTAPRSLHAAVTQLSRKLEGHGIDLVRPFAAQDYNAAVDLAAHPQISETLEREMALLLVADAQPDEATARLADLELADAVEI